MSKNKTVVTFTHTEDRRLGVSTSLRALGGEPAKGKHVFLKPNFNTADLCPGSTHNDTLAALVEELWQMGARTITVGDRSFPPTRQVMKEKGVLPMLARLGAEVLDFDTLPAGDWVEFRPSDSHWPDGFRIARPILEAECLVSTCCLKTHQYGGVFTLSLKLHVGVVPTTRNGFPYMNQLHNSPHQRRMIAELNAPFRPDLVILDGVEAFVDGGPMVGTRARGNVFLASTDRVAIDAAGVAVLKSLGSNRQIMEPKIFAQEQLARAAELGLGVGSAQEIELSPADAGSREPCATVARILEQG